MIPETVPAPHRVAMKTTAPLVHLCPFKDEVDEGSVTITWECEGKTFELHSLREYLDTFKDKHISHEHLMTLLKRDLDVEGLTVVVISSRWGTAGMDVGCSI